MDNARPSDYALKFAQRRDHPATQRTVLAELRRRHAYDCQRSGAPSSVLYAV